MGDREVPSQIYVVVNKCENLPDLRTNAEIAKCVIPKWQVICKGVKESLATQLTEGFNEAIWMCEMFYTIINPKSIQLCIVDQKGREAGYVPIDLTEGMPIADGVRIKPGPDVEGYRETLRKQQPQIICTLQTNNKKFVRNNIILKYWLWITKYKTVNPKTKSNTIGGGIFSNLQKLTTLSRSNNKSAMNLTDNSDSKNPFSDYMERDKPINEEDTSGSYDGNRASAGNPFSEATNNPATGRVSRFEHPVGNSTFANIHPEHFRPSVWIPKRPRCSSLTMVDEARTEMGIISDSNTAPRKPIDAKNPFLQSLNENNEGTGGVQEPTNYKEQLQKFKSKVLSDNNTDLEVENDVIDKFFQLGDLYRASTKTKNKDDQISINQHFFTTLNDIQRRYSSLLNHIKSLEAEKEQSDLEQKHNTSELLRIKQKLIVKGMLEILQDDE